MQTIQTKSTLTRAETAAFLDVSIFLMNQWASEGKGPRFIKVGRQSVYRLEVLETFKAVRESTVPASIKTASHPIPDGAYIMRLREVMKKTGLGKSTIYERMRAGTFVQGISLGGREVGWPSHLVEQWLTDRINAVQGVV